MRKWRKETYLLPPVDGREVLRYAGVKGEPSEQLRALLQTAIAESAGEITPRVAACVLTKAELFERIQGAKESKGLQRAIANSEEVLLFAATIGLGLDRKILRAAAIQPSKALFLQAIGAERIEALCDAVCGEFAPAGKRFSPGYGDFPLTAQASIFQLLDCPKTIGLTLTEGLMMRPTKSVTAIVGLGDTDCGRGCVACEREHCEYRK